MVVTDEQLISLTQAFKSLPITDPNRGRSPTDFGVPVNSQGWCRFSALVTLES